MRPLAERVRRPTASGPSASPELELVVSVHRTAAFLMEWAEQALEPVDVRPDEYNVLRILRGAGPAGLAMAEVSRRMIHDAARLPALVHRLRTRGLIAGALRLTLTAEGRDLLASTDGLLESALVKRVGRVDAARLVAAREVLERIRGD
ncbi:MAG TPA: hypothetical protein VF263_14860 [Longimicrobiaceae bacterium]